MRGASACVSSLGRVGQGLVDTANKRVLCSASRRPISGAGCIAIARATSASAVHGACSQGACSESACS